MTPDPIKILICGSRGWTDKATIHRMIDKLYDLYGERLVIIHGASRGADKIAGEYALSQGIPQKSYPAEWEKHGRSAGFIRNKQMLDEEQPYGVIAFDLGTPGTAHTVRLAQERGVRCVVKKGR